MISINKKRALTAVIGCLVISTTLGQFNADDFVSGRSKVRGLIVPFYAPYEHEPLMVIRIDRTYTDHERKGFFRIGVLPLGVMDGVTFEIQQAKITNSLADLHNWLGRHSVNHFELRTATFLILGRTTNRLESGCAQIVSSEKWKLSDGVRCTIGTNCVRAKRATLWVAGDKAGQIIMATTPSVTNNLFFCTAPQISHQKELP